MIKKIKCHMKWCYSAQRHEDGTCDRNCFYNTVEVTTNADKIRCMSDEELALQLYSQRLKGFEGFLGTKEEVLEWLKGEAYADR